MKKNLLFLILPLLFSAVSINAQTKSWDFSNATLFPLTTGNADVTSPLVAYTEKVVDNLGLYACSSTAATPITNFGAVNASVTTFATTDAFGPTTNRFQLNGAGGVVAPINLPIQRYLYFTVSGPCTVKVWFKGGNSTSTRSVLVTDGTNVVGTASSVNGVAAEVIANYTTAGGGKLYVYADASCNLYKVEVTGATVLANNNFQPNSSVSVFSNGKQVNVANVTSETQVNVYNMTGALVKSVATVSDLNFELNSGFYIVNVKSAEGEKSVKVVVK